MNRAAKTGIIGACAVALGLGGFGAYDIAHGQTRPSAGRRRTVTPAAESSTPPPTAKAGTFARGFLKDWAAGPAHYTAAAGETDAPKDARQALDAYRAGVKLRSLAFSDVATTGTDPRRRNAVRVTFTATARLAAGTWSYPGVLDVVQDAAGQQAVRWSPSVLHPQLGAGQSLRLGSLAPPASQVRVLARDGKTRLTGERFPSLAAIVSTIGAHAAATEKGRDGSGVTVVNTAGASVATLKVFKEPTAVSVRTTIDAGLQAAAEKAVHDRQVGGKPAGVVALDRHNGHIRAVAYDGPDGDIAINAAKAPGSTMKIITSAALFDRAGMTPDSTAPCLKTQAASGQVFHNEADVPANPDATLLQAFAESCNTAFVKEGFDHLVHGGDDAADLHDEAHDMFGFGSWSIGGGVQTTDPSVPATPSGGDKAAQFIGQGQVTASPLVLASVAATVRDGAFHQPVILPDQPQTPAPHPLSPTTAGYLQRMMRAVATSGTASARLGTLSGVGAKTGTAEEGDGTNGWLTAYNDDLAVASLVEGGSSGVGSAGYVVWDLLTAR
ncbi:penicillin-binding transpeptidase domain-containing protein [Streptomyces sp. NBC_00252]|uniref:penicillin-binding transpeptidase domain-containing protein n=1 Tax=Streptomyces sp. NBC_00252 TaxID=2975691 RepID=UPI002E2BED2B|nr:penicillin-binding transpeptidase domain-containing protein [Streptomyces sp. NBC_00252]